MTSIPVRPGVPPDTTAAVAAATVAAATDRAIAGIGRVRVQHPTGPRGAGGAGGSASIEQTIPAAALANLIGAEAARYALVRHARNPAAAIDLDTWRRADEQNPIHLVRLAHARLAALARYARALGLTVNLPGSSAPEIPTGPVTGAAALSDSAESAAATATTVSAIEPATALLRRTLEEFPAVFDHAATRRQPHRLTRLLERTALAVNDYLATVRVLPSSASPASASLTMPRLALADDARRSLAAGLAVLGITAPERL